MSAIYRVVGANFLIGAALLTTAVAQAQDTANTTSLTETTQGGGIQDDNERVEPLPAPAKNSATGARAQPLSAPTTTEALDAAPTRPDIRDADANADRVVLLPTAETHPKGSLYFSAHELIFWQLGYALTDRIQATVTTWPVIVKDQPFFIDGAIKANLYRSNLARLAVAAGVTYVSSELDSVNNTASVGRLAAIGQLCLTEGCWTSLVGGVSGWIPLSHGTGSLYSAGLGLTAKISKHVGFLLEFDSGAAYDGELRFAEGGLVNYGVRFSGKNIGVDLSMIKPTFGGPDELVMGVPWLSFTYRSDPLSW